MKVVDAHSGEELRMGVPLVHDGGDSFTLLAVKPGLTKARMLVRGTTKNPVTGAITTETHWIDGPVWYFHPAGKGSWRVAIFPS